MSPVQAVDISVPPTHSFLYSADVDSTWTPLTAEFYYRLK